MKERCSRDREMSHPFAVEWLKVVHMPFMIFDRLGTNVLILSPTDRHVKLDRMEDGTEWMLSTEVNCLNGSGDTQMCV